jgi:hypothetical protein
MMTMLMIIMILWWFDFDMIIIWWWYDYDMLMIKMMMIGLWLSSSSCCSGHIIFQLSSVTLHIILKNENNQLCILSQAIIRIHWRAEEEKASSPQTLSKPFIVV